MPSEIAGFTAPLGTTIGMPGCAGIWPILLAVYAINALGIRTALSDYAVLVILGLLVSIGTAGVPGTATVTATTVLAAAGLPLEVVILTLPISALADMARTTNNVTSAAVARRRRPRRAASTTRSSKHPTTTRTTSPAWQTPATRDATDLPLTTAALFDAPSRRPCRRLRHHDRPLVSPPGGPMNASSPACAAGPRGCRRAPPRPAAALQA